MEYLFPEEFLFQEVKKLFHGKLKEDLWLINYHDKAKPLGLGKGERTLSWRQNSSGVRQ